jgi:hypothetical protein
LRRLSPEEYAHTARDLLAAPQAAPKLEEAAGETITALEVEKLGLASRELVALARHHSYLPCDVSGASNAACADKFIDAFGKAAFRRPLEPTEKSWLQGVYTRVSQLAGHSPPISFREAIDTVAEVILQSPQHIYVHEAGIPDRALPAGVRRLSGYERAARLSYFVWSSMPDPALTQAADAGRLDSKEGVRTEAERLFSHPRAKEMVRRFASSWLELDPTPQHPALEMFAKSAQRFPFDNAALRTALRAETESLYERIFFEPGGSFRALLTTHQAYVDGPLAALYGVTGGPTQAGQFAWVDLDATRRAGLFTRAAFLAAQAGVEYQAPIRRGVFIYRNVLCQPLPDPPADADNTPPIPSESSQLRSVRALTAAKTSGDSCATCHVLVNPIGFALENYDAMGQWQTEEKGTVGGQPYTAVVDARASIMAGDLTGEVDGGVALSRMLADSQMARDCAVERWFEKALSRQATSDDACLLSQMKAGFRQKDDLRDLVLTIASSDAALFIKETQ